MILRVCVRIVPHEDAVLLALQRLRQLATGRLAIEICIESALGVLSETLVAQFPLGTIPMLLPSQESEQNGSVENGVKLSKGVVCVHLHAL